MREYEGSRQEREVIFYDDNHLIRSYSLKHQDGCWIVGEIPETDIKAIQTDHGIKDYVKDMELAW